MGLYIISSPILILAEKMFDEEFIPLDMYSYINPHSSVWTEADGKWWALKHMWNMGENDGH